LRNYSILNKFFIENSCISKSKFTGEFGHVLDIVGT
jgi:hypothetical protein